MKNIEDYRKGLVCLVPRPGAGGLTCHEKTLCDCEVLEIFAEYDKYKKAFIESHSLLKHVCPDSEIVKHHQNILEEDAKTKTV